MSLAIAIFGDEFSDRNFYLKGSICDRAWMMTKGDRLACPIFHLQISNIFKTDEFKKQNVYCWLDASKTTSQSRILCI